jgi:hypothetical protein
MTGYDIYKKVLSISGYSASDQADFSQQVILERMPDIINQICFDLKIPSISELENIIGATPKQIDALCYGVAMLLAVSEGETEKNKLFAQIYNSKRAAVLCETQSVEDKLPYISYGDD